jgi:hypothetical protein
LAYVTWYNRKEDGEYLAKDRARVKVIVAVILLVLVFVYIGGYSKTDADY